MSQRRLRLGRKTLGQLIDYLHPWTWAALRHFLFKHGLDQRFSGDNKLSALGKVFHPLVTTEDEAEIQQAYEALEGVATNLFGVIKGEIPDVFGAEYERADENYEKFRTALRADGYDLDKGRIVPFPSPSVNVPREEGVLERRLAAFGFTEAQRHLEQAQHNSARGNWEAANSQIGSFMESLCEGIAAKLHSGPGKPPSRGEARKHLQEAGFLPENEANLLRSFFQVLHSPGGRHAGTSSEDDCHRRRLIAVALANYYLEMLSSPTS